MSLMMVAEIECWKIFREVSRKTWPQQLFIIVVKYGNSIILIYLFISLDCNSNTLWTITAMHRYHSVVGILQYSFGTIPLQTGMFI